MLTSMSMSDARLAEEAQLISYRERRGAHLSTRHSPDAMRLFWSLDGPLETSTWIMEDANTPDSREPYVRQTTDAGGCISTSLHPASQSSITEFNISSVTVHVDELDVWENEGLDVHGNHTEPDQEDLDESEVRWGMLPDYDSEEDEEGPEHLLMCCGTQRPRGKVATIIVTPAASGNWFVTIHDYVSTVHPWLMGLPKDILAYMGMRDDKPLPSETKLMVNFDALDTLSMEEQEKWIRKVRRAPSLALLDSIFPQRGGNEGDFKAREQDDKRT